MTGQRYRVAIIGAGPGGLCTGKRLLDEGEDDFVLLDNGRKQPIPVFDDSPRPIRLIVMLDISGSMYGNLGLLRAACSARRK